MNFLYCNNTPSNLDPYHAEIAESLKKDGTLPLELQDLFIVTAIPQGNPDGSTRYIIDAA